MRRSSLTHLHVLHRSAFNQLLESGLTFIDTAEVYGFGKSEELIGEFSKAVTKKPIVASKFAPLPWRFSADNVEAALRVSRLLRSVLADLFLLTSGVMQDTLSRLQTNKIDLCESLAAARACAELSRLRADEYTDVQTRYTGQGEHLPSTQSVWFSCIAVVQSQARSLLETWQSLRSFPYINQGQTDLFVEGMANVQRKGMAEAVAVCNFNAKRLRRSHSIMQVSLSLSLSLSCSLSLARTLDHRFAPTFCVHLIPGCPTMI